MKSRYVRVGVPLIGVAVIAGFIFWSMSTNRGEITGSPDRAAISQPTTKHLAGTYVAFNYSGVYSLDLVNLGADDLEAYSLSAVTNYEKHVAVAVRRLNGGSIDQDTDYSSRKSHPELYSRFELTIPTGTATEFVKQDNTERTVFIIRGDTVASLSFVSTAKLDELQSEIIALLDTFQWEQ